MSIQFIYEESGEGRAPVGARSGDMVLVGGLMPVDASGRPAGSSVREQAEFVYGRLREILGRSGASLSDLVKTNLYFTAPADDGEIASFVAQVDKVRAEFLRRHSQ